MIELTKKDEHRMPVRLGRQEPTFEQVKPFKRTDGHQAAQLASAFFGEPLEWQKHVLDVMLARDERDKYLFHTVGLTIPRQNGLPGGRRLEDVSTGLFEAAHGQNKHMGRRAVGIRSLSPRSVPQKDQCVFGKAGGSEPHACPE